MPKYLIKPPKIKPPKLNLGLRYSSRERVPAKKRNEVRKRAGNKCEICRKKPRGVTLEFHHKSMKPNDNRTSNIQLLCPNHHRQKHSEVRRKYYRNILGRPYTSRLIKKKPKPKKKKRRKRPKSFLEIKPIRFRI